MPNWMSDEDSALDSGDAHTCEHCGAFVWVDESHICQEGLDASQAETDAFVEKYKGDETKLNKRLVIDIECFNTEMSLRDVLSDLSTYFEEGQHSDQILGYSWKIKSIEDMTHSKKQALRRMSL